MVKVTQGYLIANNLMALNSKLANEWHPIKNGTLKPINVTKSSNKKVWWKCDKGHEWQASVNSRDKGTRCPYCSGRKVCKDNCLYSKNSELCLEWNYKRNHRLTPYDITANSHKKVWWACKKGHEWQAPVYNRNNGSGCPLCKTKTSELELRLYTELKSLFEHVKHRHTNFGKELDVFIPQLKVGVEVDGAYWHQNRGEKDIDKNRYFKAKGINVVRIRQKPLAKICDTDIIIDMPCDYFEVVRTLLQLLVNNEVLDKDMKQIIHTYLDNGSFINNDEYIHLIKMLPSPLPEHSLAEVSSALALEWNIDKNGELTPEDVYSSSAKRVWWKCDKGHEWQSRVADRQKGYGCPYCSNNTVGTSNCLSATHPILASEWHPVKNGDITPNDVTYGAGMKVWWQCNRGHEWEAKINSRSSGTACPYCSSRAINMENCLSTKNPRLVSEWHIERNGTLTPMDVMPNSKIRVWWICEKGHEWQTTVSIRNRGSGCPYCSNNRVNPDNCLKTTNPEIASQWHPTLNGSLTPNDVTYGSGEKVWWICEKGHEWLGKVCYRKHHGCPFCVNQRVDKNNSLMALNPTLSRQWHPTKNGQLRPADITSNTHRKVWWICEKGHQWQAVVSDRNRGSGCPYCSRRKSVS